MQSEISWVNATLCKPWGIRILWCFWEPAPSLLTSLLCWSTAREGRCGRCCRGRRNSAGKIADNWHSALRLPWTISIKDLCPCCTAISKASTCCSTTAGRLNSQISGGPKASRITWRARLGPTNGWLQKSSAAINTLKKLTSLVSVLSSGKSHQDKHPIAVPFFLSRHPRPTSRAISLKQRPQTDHPKENPLSLLGPHPSVLDQDILIASFLLGDHLALGDDATSLMLNNESIIFKVWRC